MNAGCKGCTERCVTEDYNCHSHCEKYKEWKAEQDENRKREQMRVSIDAITIENVFRTKCWLGENKFLRKHYRRQGRRG